MDDDDALPPPIRCASWQLNALHNILDESRRSDNDTGNEENRDNTSAPLMKPRRGVSVGSPPNIHKDAPPPLPKKSPLRLRPEPLRLTPKPPTRNFSHPFKSQTGSQIQHQIQSSGPTPKHVSNYAPLKPVPQGRNHRIPFSLRRCSSLETIQSVATAHSTQDKTPQDENPGDEPQDSYLYYLEPGYSVEEYGVQGEAEKYVEHLVDKHLFNDKSSPRGRERRYICVDEEQRAVLPRKLQPTLGVHQPTRANSSPERKSVHLGYYDGEGKPRRRSIVGGHATEDSRLSEASLADSIITQSSASSSIRSAATTSASPHSSQFSGKSSTSKVLRKLKSRPQLQESEPLHLAIERRVSIDQRSIPSSSSGSVPTMSSDRRSEVYPSASNSANTSEISQSSRDWKASTHDISHLTEAELKKCKKKGINPASYAEMKAARKGKIISPISGNTLL